MNLRSSHIESKDSTLGAKLGAFAMAAAVVTEGTADGTGVVGALVDGSSTSGGAADLGMEEEGVRCLTPRSQPRNHTGR